MVRSSIKKVLPAVLEQSDYLQQRYGQVIYGTAEMPSLNFPEDWVWLKKMDGHVLDPYKLLDPLPFESEIQEAIENGMKRMKAARSSSPMAGPP